MPRDLYAGVPQRRVAGERVTPVKDSPFYRIAAFDSRSRPNAVGVDISALDGRFLYEARRGTAKEGRIISLEGETLITGTLEEIRAKYGSEVTSEQVLCLRQGPVKKKMAEKLIKEGVVPAPRRSRDYTHGRGK